MVCVYCSGSTEVTNSRSQKRLNQVWRRRHCLSCGAVFSTHEAAVFMDAWRVTAKNGQLRPFVKNRLFLSLYKALEHRPDAIEDATALTDTVISLLPYKVQEGVIDASKIAETAYLALKNFDTPAAVHYQAFHSE